MPGWYPALLTCGVLREQVRVKFMEKMRYYHLGQKSRPKKTERYRNFPHPLVSGENSFRIAEIKK